MCTQGGFSIGIFILIMPLFIQGDEIVHTTNETVRVDHLEPFCISLEYLQRGTKRIMIKDDGTLKVMDRQCLQFNDENLMFFLSLFVIIALGAAVRTFLRITKIPLPYTVILMICGLIIGLGTRIPGNLPGTDPKNPTNYCSSWSVYTKIARIPPKIILYTFLPVLIFESAFNMKVHVFTRSAWQILIVALPGMLITTFITALVCQHLMQTYWWTYVQASFFGSIISATDPVAVVSILRELGTSDTLSTIIEGESLLNDGVAILLYDIFKHIIEKPNAESSEIATDVVLKFLRICLGGPLLGLVIGKISVVCLSLIFNDSAVEITITLVAAYITYYLGETFEVSGVVAVVVLGLIMNDDRTSISPECEVMVHHFWEMLGYLANTVLFVIVGILITETAINQIDWDDVFYLGLFYITVNVIRLGMLMILMPWLSRIGYGLNWRDMITMMWGGLRGAVGLCLALEVYRNKIICEADVYSWMLGPQFLFHTAGIVFLTLVINGTTTKTLLNALGMTTVSQGRLQDMSNAVKQINSAQIRTLAVLKHDRFLADANWDMVDKFTEIYDPYKEERRQNQKPVTVNSIISIKIEENDNIADDEDFDYEVVTEPSPEEYKNMTEEARLRILKTLKVSFSRQHEQGVLTEESTQILTGVAEITADKELRMIHARDFRIYFTVHGFYNWFRIHVITKLGLDAPGDFPPSPNTLWRYPFWWLSTRDWFEGLIHGIVLLNMIPIIWQTVIQIKDEPVIDALKVKKKKHLTNTTEDIQLEKLNNQLIKSTLIFFIINCIFTGIYVLEFFIKVIGHGCKLYWSSKWNWLDVFILIVSFIDIIVVITTTEKSIRPIRICVQIFRLSRISRSLRLFRPLLPKIYKIIDGHINSTLFLGYDIGKGFVTAVDDVLKFLPQIVEHPRVLHKLKTALEHERLEAVRAIGLLQKEHHRIAIAVKTRHACRAVLNQMRETLNELKEDGLLDDKENTILNTRLEEKMKRLWNTPSSIHPSSPAALLLNVVWVLGNIELGKFCLRRANLLNFSFGDVICSAGDAPNGVYIIISGMIKIHYKPKDDLVKNQYNFGIIPNVDLFIDMDFDTEETDFFSTGTVIGELGVLTEQNSAGTVTCETDVVAYHINKESMRDMLRQFCDRNDSLEARLWRSFGMRITAALLTSETVFQSWTLDKIRMHLERSAVPIGLKFETMTVPDFIANVILIYGQIMDAHTKIIYTAPYLLPHTCTKICPVEGTRIQGKILVVAHEEIDHEEVPDSSTSLHHVVLNSSSMRRDKPSTPESRVSFRQRRLSQAINYGVRERRKSLKSLENDS